MARSTDPKAEPISLWTAFEAEQLELEAYVSTRLGISDTDAEEPGWVAEALTASWPRTIAEAAAAVC